MRITNLRAICSAVPGKWCLLAIGRFFIAFTCNLPSYWVLYFWRYFQRQRSQYSRTSVLLVWPLYWASGRYHRIHWNCTEYAPRAPAGWPQTKWLPFRNYKLTHTWRGPELLNTSPKPNGLDFRILYTQSP